MARCLLLPNLANLLFSNSPVAATRFRARRSARRRAVGVYGVHETPWVHVTHIARAELVMAAIVLGVGSCVWMRLARKTRGVECWRRGSLGGEVVSRPLFWPTGGRPITARQMEIEDFSREILQATRRSGVNRSGSARGRLTPILNPDPEPSLSTHCNERRAPPAMPLSTSTQLERRTTINPSRPWISSVPDFYCWRTLVSYDKKSRTSIRVYTRRALSYFLGRFRSHDETTNRAHAVPPVRHRAHDAGVLDPRPRRLLRRLLEGTAA